VSHRWLFPVQSWRVYDGDTITATVDLGFALSITITCRLWGINTPEVRGPEREAGLLVRDWLIDRLDDAKTIKIETRPPTERGTGKYGRWLIILWANEENLNEAMVRDGLALRYF